MSNTAIKVEDLSKIYRLGEIGTGTISRDMERWFKTKVLKQEDPFLKIGETNDRANKGKSDIVYSLQDINFEIQQGDAVGIIGRNGSGKSTLLKILSRVTTPTTGRINIKGRVASLLEVGTGFHPELTGRENIYLNGAILGMRKREIDRKLDEIIDFSGVERYIDTPVKRYSSGMYVRLAFAVAAHLESEILIVDEVLAVGDAEFQKKCLGKMGEVSKGEGRTVLFVSHNMGAIKQLCNKGILLQNGRSSQIQNINEIIDQYSLVNINQSISSRFNCEIVENKQIQLLEAKLVDDKYVDKRDFDISEDINIIIKIRCTALVKGLYGYIIVKNTKEEVFIESDTFDFSDFNFDNLKIGINYYHLKIQKHVLPMGEHIVYLNFNSDFNDVFTLDSPKEILKFFVRDSFTKRSVDRSAYTSQIIKWKKIDVK
jgi:lipopolysaccharide transport system ATP-binding protein